MSYARVEDSIWDELRPLADEEKLLEVYLRTCKHRTKLGVFVLPPYYAVADLEWDDPNVVVEILNGLQESGRIGWDPEARIVYVPTMHVDPPQNSNVVTHALKELRAIPRTPLLLRLLEEVEAATAGAEPDSKEDELAKGIRQICSRHGLDLPIRTSGSDTDSAATGLVGSDRVTPTAPETVQEPSANGSGLHIQDPTHVNTSSAPSSKPRTAEVDQESVSDAWKEVRETIVDDWHLGHESIQVGKATINMAREEQLFRELARGYDIEQLVGAICHAREVFGFEEPHALLWFTAREHGPANFNRASAAFFRANSLAPNRRKGNGLQRVNASRLLLGESR